MSKWISETFELESKAQLKEHREHKMQELLMDNGLKLSYYPFWSQADKDLELALWLQADEDYEKRKNELRNKLKALSSSNLDIYFDEIGVVKVPIDDFLQPSPI
mgnify:CR=1 FL=1